MKKITKKLIGKAIGLLALSIFMTLGGAYTGTAATAESLVPLTGTLLDPAGIQQRGGEKAREKAKKRYERQQKKIAKQARKIEKQKARIEKMDRKIEKTGRDMEKQARRVEGLERDLQQAERQGTNDADLSRMRVKLNKERLKHSKLANSLHKQKAKLEKALKKVAR